MTLDTIYLFATAFNDWTEGGKVHLVDVRLVAGENSLSLGASFRGIGIEIGVEVAPWRGHS